MGAETRIRKYRATHQIVTMVLIFLMGVALGWVLRGAPEVADDGRLPVDTARVPAETPEETPDTEAPASEASPQETPEPAMPAGPQEPSAPESGTTEEPEALVPEAPPEPTPGEPAPEATESIAAVEDVWPARHLIIAVSGPTLSSEDRAFLSEIKPGGVVLLKGNIEHRNQTIKLVESIKEAVGLGTQVYDLPLIAVDQEGGAVNRLNLESSPGAPELGAKRDPELARQAGRDVAQSCKDRGIGLLLAPVLDVTLPGAPEIIKTRSFGKDRDVVQAIGLAFADGAMQGGVAPIVKHYPGHGAATQDSHARLAVIELKESEELAKVLYPFAQAVVAGIPGIMVGHIAVPHLEDPEHPLRPASLSPRLVREFLRDRWNFQGVIVSDDIAMAGAVVEGSSVEKAAVEALAAGCDALILADPSRDRIRAVCAAIEGAVNAGVLSSDGLNESKRRLDALQAWLKAPAGLPGDVPALPGGAASPTQAQAETPESPAPVAETAAETPAAVEEKPAETPSATKETTPESTASTTGVDASVEPASAAVPESAPEAAETEPEAPAPMEEAAATQPEPAAPPMEPAKEQAAEEKPAEEAPKPAVAPAKPARHEVKPGDTLTRIASRYGVSIADLKAWNDLDGEKILIGQKLKVSPP